MEIICNELSYNPLADSNQEAERRFNLLFNTFKKSKEKYGFKRIRFHTDYATQQITAEHTFKQWVPTITNSTLRNTIITFFRKPYADDDLEIEDLEALFYSKYTLTDNGVPTETSPFGLPIAFIKSKLVISFDSHEFWHNRKINILKSSISDSGTEELNFLVYNICLPSDIKEKEISEWADKYMSINVDSQEMLEKYLAYEKYTISFGDYFLAQLFEWRNDDMELFKRTLLLMKDVQLHPFMGGMGKTENLRGHGKEASKRITGEHRLSYEIINNRVTFLACKGHYEFH